MFEVVVFQVEQCQFGVVGCYQLFVVEVEYFFVGGVQQCGIVMQVDYFVVVQFGIEVMVFDMCYCLVCQYLGVQMLQVCIVGDVEYVYVLVVWVEDWCG